MKLNIKNVLRINNSIENTVYYRGFPIKLMQFHNLPQQFEIIINSLIITSSFLYYINSYKNKTDMVWINISLLSGLLGREELRLDLPSISISIINLEILRRTSLYDEFSLFSSFYYQEVHRQMEEKIKYNKIINSTNSIQYDKLDQLFNNCDLINSGLKIDRFFIKLSNKNEGFNNKEQLSIF